jgi:cell division protein FtsI (penicillin-binding protein 3)
VSDQARNRTRLAGLCLSAVFVVLAGKAGFLALATPPPARTGLPVAEVAGRADIVDRNGELLATSVTAYSLVANPQAIWDAGEVATALAGALPGIDARALTERLADPSRSFVYVKRGMTPRQRKAVFDLGLEGLRFEEERRRAYPRGTAAGHVLGYASIDGEGLSGIEYALNDRLKTGGEPVRLTIDNGVQASVETELSIIAAETGMIGGAAILMDARSGEIRAMASWPPFDPNRAQDTPEADPGRLNRATGAVYELGSVFKPLTVAAAIDAGAVRPADLFNVTAPLEISGFKVRDTHPLSASATITDIIAESSNIGTVQINAALGARRQYDFLTLAGLTLRAPIELPGSASPILPAKLDELSAATASYGHGIAVTPLAFLAAFSAFANGGERVTPTLVADARRRPETVRLMSAVSAELVNTMMREAVLNGTGAAAEVAGYRIAGKTGTAEKPVKGGYDATRNVTSFAAVFPYDRPQYALIVTLDEAEGGARHQTTAAYTAAPVAGRMIERVAPLLGLAPRFEDVRPDGPALDSSGEKRSAL